MNVKPWKLPWKNKMVPHAVLDIQRGCNISCRACYNLTDAKIPKPLHLIEKELNKLLKIRRLSSVSIVGGEVTLHPQLLQILELVKTKGIHVELLTNGLDVDTTLCEKMKNAGLDVLYFHVEKGQKRPDLSNDDSKAVNQLRKEKAEMAAQAGLDVGLTATAYPNEMEDVLDVVEFTLSRPEINYLLVTLFRDNSNVESLEGDVRTGFSGTGSPPDPSTLMNNSKIAELLKKELGIEPFAFMGSNLNPDDPRWLSYLVGSVRQANGTTDYAHLQISALEKTAMFLLRIAGQYPMYMPQNPARFRKQLRLNAFLGGAKESNKRLIKLSNAPGASITAKRLLFQNPAQLADDGSLIHCESCPDAVLKNDKLVPVCITDSIT